ncbi:MAG: type II toxin-antitoxin system HicB family antitoxin [Dehalococcoidia bacterium]
MEKQTVHAVIYKDGAGEGWLATCLELNVTTQGDTAEHAAEMIREAVELHIEDMTADELETLYQPVAGAPIVREITIDAPALLHR